MSLIPHLGNQFGISCGGIGQHFSLIKGTAHGLFNVNTLSKLHGGHANREMSKVGDCNLYSINVARHCIEHNPEIPKLFSFWDKLYCCL